MKHALKGVASLGCVNIMKKNNFVLSFNDVWKTYLLGEIKVSAVKGINFNIIKGEFVAIMGASGSGKSTVLNLIGSMDTPTTGKVIIDGYDMGSFNESELARMRGKKIGFVFQTFNLHPTLNVFENIALPMRIHEYDEEKIKTNVNTLATLVGMNHRIEHLPNQLSGGERQRVAIARALSAEPEILLADEPTGNLDSKTSYDILKIFEDLHKKHNKTIIMVTHENDIAKYAKRIIELKDGNIIYDGKNKLGGIKNGE